MLSNLSIMPNLHQVVNLCSSADAGLPKGGTIYTRAAADFNIVLDHDATDLGNFTPGSGVGHKTEAVRSKRRVGMNDTPGAEARSLA
jgi:hypothetical protein